jgi:hypothetical protein
MGRYIVAYHAPLTARQRLAQATPQEAMAGVQQWIGWAQRLGPKLVDPGKPFGQAMRVTSEGTSPTQSDIVGISIIDADDMTGALALVGDHHHLHWAPGCEITVHEEIAIPEMDGQH